MQTISVVVRVLGVSEVDNKVFLLFSDCKIKVYSVHPFSKPSTITVEGLGTPRDIVACRDYLQLYVAESDCIWQVSTKDHQQYEKWLTDPPFRIRALSIRPRSQRLLVTSESCSLHQFSTTNREQLRVVNLAGLYVKLDLGVETTRGTFVVCHGGTSRDKGQSAVSKLNCYCTHHLAQLYFYFGIRTQY